MAAKGGHTPDILREEIDESSISNYQEVIDIVAVSKSNRMPQHRVNVFYDELHKASPKNSSLNKSSNDDDSSPVRE